MFNSAANHVCQQPNIKWVFTIILPRKDIILFFLKETYFEVVANAAIFFTMGSYLILIKISCVDYRLGV